MNGRNASCMEGHLADGRGKPLKDGSLASCMEGHVADGWASC